MAREFDLASLHTVHLVPLTAFKADGTLNLEAQAALTRRLYAAGIRCFLPAAGTSEFHSLSADEIVALVRVTREASGSDAVIFSPVGLQLAHAIESGRRSIAAGADGIMFMPLSHPYLCDVGMRDYYMTVLDAVKAPALVYKKDPLPSNALLLELAKHPSVVGVKYAWNQMHEFRSTVLADREGIEWLCGSAERFAPYYMLAGSRGYTSGAGNVCPHLTMAMHTALAAGEYSEGMRYQQLIIPIEDYRARQGDSLNISMLKHAVKITGLDFGPARAPQRQLTAAEMTEIETLLKPILAAEAELSGESAALGLSGH